MTKQSAIYDDFAHILANTSQESIAVAAFRAIRTINPRGSLFVVRPKVLVDRKDTLNLEDIRDQVYRDLDRGIAFSRIARVLRVDHRKVKRLVQDWGRMSEPLRQVRRDEWAAQRRRQAETLELGRDVANSRTVARLRLPSE